MPRAAWDAANPVREPSAPRSEPRSEPPVAELLTALLARLGEREAAELREARALAEKRGEEIAELRERIGRAEAERDRAQAELAAGPLARAVRWAFRRRG